MERHIRTSRASSSWRHCHPEIAMPCRASPERSTTPAAVSRRRWWRFPRPRCRKTDSFPGPTAFLLFLSPGPRPMQPKTAAGTRIDAATEDRSVGPRASALFSSTLGRETRGLLPPAPKHLPLLLCRICQLPLFHGRIILQLAFLDKIPNKNIAIEIANKREKI